jgi:molybdenum cofactor biosynthesis enzyme MoaA
VAGRRYPIGCVSLEITQRCNLDCTLCYLSENSEAVRDLPLEELFRRIDTIRAHYGTDTDIQISGGEPTLRARDELLAIVRYVVASGMRASLFTNGILATRELLAELAQAGLTDVAFHVDLTQQRKGYDSEQALDAVRARCIEAARGLPLSVFFNTTVFDGNLAEVPHLVRFFARHADVVRFVSFQLQADTGRGVLGARAPMVSQASVMAAIEQGAGTRLEFGALTAGHDRCNKFAMAWVIGDRLHDALADREYVQRVMRATASTALPRRTRTAAARAFVRALLAQPALWRPTLRYLARTAWQARAGLWRARGKVDKLSFFVHNFMDACALEKDRIEACVFMAATVDGPLSMCAYNARRDDFVLRPIRLADGTTWQPLSAPGTTRVFPLKLLKGRARAEALARRARNAAAPERADGAARERRTA